MGTVCQHGLMGRSAKLLGADERVVLRLRTHAKALILPASALILVGALLGAGAALIPSAYRPGGEYAVAVAAAALAGWWSATPFLRWWTRTYTVTNHRLIASQGILNKVGTVLPLTRINDVSYQRSLLDRMLGCGTLIISTAGEGAVVLDDVPDLEHVHLVLTGLLFDPAALTPGHEPSVWPAPEEGDPDRRRPTYGAPAPPVRGEKYGPPR